jgi:D-alanine-D-alanine ligase
MDKEQAKVIFRSKDLPTPAGISLDRESMDSKLQAASEMLSFPMILKPQSGGSTIAVYRVETAAELLRAAQAILADFDTVLVETFIAGRELTVGILMIGEAEVALPVIEIRFPGSLFDYAAKYTDGEAQFLAPAPLSLEETLYVQDIALRAHQALGCHAYSRVDLRLGTDGIAYLLEANTLPGMTPLSDLPRAARIQGISYDALVSMMLPTATHSQEQPLSRKPHAS